MQTVRLNNGVYQLTPQECERCVLDALDRGRSSFFSHQDPAMVEWFAQMVEARKKPEGQTVQKKW
jgi:2,5-diketo-D-gluconate reductase A